MKKVEVTCFNLIERTDTCVVFFIFFHFNNTRKKNSAVDLVP